MSAKSVHGLIVANLIALLCRNFARPFYILKHSEEVKLIFQFELVIGIENIKLAPLRVIF
jgi:hypothetical protein